MAGGLKLKFTWDLDKIEINLAEVILSSVIFGGMYLVARHAADGLRSSSRTGLFAETFGALDDLGAF